MKVILIKQVEKIGNAGDVLEVAPGYGRNFLIAKGIAIEATSDTIRNVQNKKKKTEQHKQRHVKKINKLTTALEGQTILVRASANEEGHLFGGISPKQIADTIKKRKKIDIDYKKIILPHHLKALGKHCVMLQLSVEEKIKFNVDVQKLE